MVHTWRVGNNHGTEYSILNIKQGIPDAVLRIEKWNISLIAGGYYGDRAIELLTMEYSK